MEKVLDCGLFTTTLSNITQKIQNQVFSRQSQLDKDTAIKKKKDFEDRQSMSDYLAFINKCKQSQNLLPSIFDNLSIKQKQFCFQKDSQKMLDSSYPLLGRSIKDLIQMCTIMINREKSSNFYSEKNLRKIIKIISKGYNINSYHCFTHGVSLMHLLQDCFRKDKQLKQMYSVQEINFCLLAAIAHDINHPGTNNSYEIKKNSEWAIQAENQSVLQKMHIRYLFDIFRKEKSFELQKYCQNPLMIKQLITRVILSTDIACHFSNLQKLKKLLNTKKFDKNNYDHRYLIMENLFHACDIGNPCLPYKEYKSWATLVVYQFNHQSQVEKKENLEISEYLCYKGRRNFLIGQTNFINVFIYPLWKQLSIKWPGLNPFVQAISINLTKLKIDAQNQKDQHEQLFFQVK